MAHIEFVEFVAVPAGNGRYHVYLTDGRDAHFVGAARPGRYVYDRPGDRPGDRPIEIALAVENGERVVFAPRD